MILFKESYTFHEIPAFGMAKGRFLIASSPQVFSWIMGKNFFNEVYSQPPSNTP